MHKYELHIKRIYFDSNQNMNNIFMNNQAKIFSKFSVNNKNSH